jgi:hypothetical protein
MSRIILILLVATSLGAFGQSYVKTNIKGVKLRDNGAIIQNNQVTGYYFFYNLEATSGQTNNYALIILDENLREVNSTQIIQAKSFSILEVAFNGEAFAVLGYDTRANAFHLFTYDTNLKEIARIMRVVSNRNLNQAYGAYVSGNEPEQSFLVPVPKRGFLVYHMTQDNEPHYRIDMMSNKLDNLWHEESGKAADIEVATSSLQNSRYIGSLIEIRSRRGAKDLQYDLVINDAVTGQRLFRKPMKWQAFDLAVSDVKYDSINKQFVAFGEYYAETQREARDKSLGFMTMVFDTTGAVVQSKTTSWKDLSNVAPVTQKGKIDGENYHVMFHNTLRTADGQLFVIGEQYKKAASAGGIALNVLSVALGGGSTASTVQLEVGGMVIFQFNPDYTINKVHFFDKQKSTFMLPSGSMYISPKGISHYGKAIGAFDYRFTQVSADYESFVASYVDYSRSEGQSAFVVGSIVYTPEKTFTLDKFNLQRRTNAFYVGRAKEGYILITEYFKKDRKLESRLEKINY